MERAVDAEGDERIDRHEWQLQERGGQLLGFWNRSRTWSSADGRPFACNQQLRYTESARHWLKGSLVGGAVKATVTGWFRDPGPCQGGLPPVQSCRLLPRGRRQLLVDCGAGPMLLQRRLDDPVPLELAERRPGSLTGVWTWQLRSTDPEGDLKQEVEVWQLRQRGEQIEGHYDRLVVVRSSDGRRFQCNQQLQYRSQARFRVRGWVRGQQLQLEETGFTASPDRCETGYRSLDRYQGRVDPDGEIITLTWGRGAQLLYRRY